jgi:pimeloyl-ACP methyl ester carboxylesterase
MGIHNAPIIGHALGASVALEYASRYQDRVQKIMAVSLPISSDCINRKLIDFANNSMIAKVMWWRQINKEVQKEAEKTAEGVINLSLQSAAQVDIKAHLNSIGRRPNSVMLLAVYGEKDDVIDPSPTRDLDGSWQNIRPIGLSDSKHFPMLDEASKFNRLLKDFLDVEDDLSVLELKEEWRRRTR